MTMAVSTVYDAETDNEQAVLLPHATDALGSSLRTIFGNDSTLSPEMLRMLQSLDYLTAP